MNHAWEVFKWTMFGVGCWLTLAVVFAFCWEAMARLSEWDDESD